jgi:hypothetical protein
MTRCTRGQSSLSEADGDDALIQLWCGEGVPGGWRRRATCGRRVHTVRELGSGVRMGEKGERCWALVAFEKGRDGRPRGEEMQGASGSSHVEEEEGGGGDRRQGGGARPAAARPWRLHSVRNRGGRGRLTDGVMWHSAVSN